MWKNKIKEAKDLIINRSFKDAYIIVSDNATIESVSDNATITLFALASIVLLYGAKKIIAKGFNIIRQIGESKIDMELGKDVTFVQIKKTINNSPTFDMYKRMYPIPVKGKKVIMYKSVHKNGDIYSSDYNKSFTYNIGETKEEEIDTNNLNSCSKGIHISHLKRAIDFGRNRNDMAILECEVNPKNIIVSKDCDGKVRASKIKVLRELPKEER